MLTVVIQNNGEDNVIELTYKNLWRELKDIPEAELLVSEDWLDYLGATKNKFICFVEADCLVNSGYFSSQLGLFQKNKYFRKLAMLTSAVGVERWENKFYGYALDQGYSNPAGDPPVQVKNHFFKPSLTKKSKAVYPVQMGYVPGAVIRTAMLKDALKEIGTLDQKDLVHMSEQLSLTFWKQGDGNRVHINPNTTYVTTEKYVNDLAELHTELESLPDMFKRESI